jgi:hypothetical protein
MAGANETNTQSTGGPTRDRKDDSSIRNRIEALIPEIVRRAFLTGLGAVFLTEDSVRRAVTDLSLPKDAVDAVIDRLGHSKDQVVETISRELRAFLDRIDIHAEVQKLLTSLTFEIKTEIRFIPNDDRVKPKMDTKFRIKRSESALREAKDSTFEEEK